MVRVPRSRLLGNYRLNVREERFVVTLNSKSKQWHPFLGFCKAVQADVGLGVGRLEGKPLIDIDESGNLKSTKTEPK